MYCVDSYAAVEKALRYAVPSPRNLGASREVAEVAEHAPIADLGGFGGEVAGILGVRADEAED